MSESSFPFQGTPVADGFGASQDEARGNRRTILILALVGVLVLGALAYFFVFSGSDEPTDTALPAPRSTGAVPTPTKAPPVAKAPKLSKKAIGKDPFKALVVPAAAGGAAAPGAAPVVGTPVTFPVTGGTPVTSGGGTPVTGGGTTTGGTATSNKPLTVKVISVTADNSSGRVTVGAKNYSVAVGDVFGTYFKTLRLKNGKCGSFQYGDERFDLCEGETARMQ
jgi:hypothetical protein